ncbi:MAG: TetR/AcrR family transcriptional regulator [Chloroflexi bacterium]|nr:TetR/AcrR family transcriptional regulator [Chloroflexota bacterium]
MTTPSTEEQHAARGRPRSAEADRAIMEATMKLLMAEGFSNLSIESVAAAAGVGKTTIYRRYSGKLELVIAAMSSFMMLGEVADTGSLRGDLLGFHSHTGHGFSLRLLAGAGSTFLGAVLSEKERNPELLATFRRLVTDRRRAQYRTVIDRAARRGEIDKSVDPDYVASVLFGSMIARTIAGMELTDKVIEQTVDNMLNGLLKR